MDIISLYAKSRIINDKHDIFNFKFLKTLDVWLENADIKMYYCLVWGLVHAFR